MKWVTITPDWAALSSLAADEVSAGVAHLFSQYAGGFQALAGKASVFHEQFVKELKAGAGSYASIEAANAALLGPLNAGARSSASAIAAFVGSVTPFAVNRRRRGREPVIDFVDKRFERFCAINQLAEIAS